MLFQQKLSDWVVYEISCFFLEFDIKLSFNDNDKIFDQIPAI